MGESQAQRIELAMALRELDVDVVPLNFLHPIPGTPLEHLSPLPPLQILSMIALFRFILPGKEIKIAGGREKNLRDLQSMIFFAGADGIILGNYLTTFGRPAEADLNLLRDLGLAIRPAGQSSSGGSEVNRGMGRPSSIRSTTA
jgi:biotin synthase